MIKLKISRQIAKLVARLLQKPRIFLYWLLSDNPILGKPRCFQPIQSVGQGKLIFGKNVNVGVFPSPLFFSTYAYIEARKPSARIYIGENTWINNNFSVIADTTSITIGKRCLIGTSVEILDSDFHALSSTERASDKKSVAQSVIIEDDVFLGSNVKVMKGVTIGKGSVIGSGSIVTKSIPENVIAAGVPARVIRSI